METKHIEIDGIPLEVEYDVSKGVKSGDYNVPDDKDDVRLWAVFCGGYDILPIITNAVEERITEKIFGI
jgi:hypothetical protein